MQDEIVKQSYDEGLLICRNLPGYSYRPCFNGILWGLSGHGEPENEHLKGLNFCRSELLPVDEKDACY